MNTPTQNVTSPGSCKIHSAVIINSKGQYIDVTNQLYQVRLFEDMFSPFITGELILSDSASTAQLLPLIGEELFVLDIETPYLTDKGQPFNRMTKTFYIYKMGDRENLAQKNVVFTLYIMSVEAFIDANTKISQTFKGNIADTATRLLQRSPGLITNKNVVVEATSNNSIHTSNFWSPVQNLYYLAEQATNSIGNPSFVFFENNEGFVFMSLDTLLSAPAMHSLERSQRMREAKGSMSNDQEYSIVLDMSVPSQYDYLDRVQHGYYGGMVYHYDIETKRLNLKNLVAKDSLSKGQLNKYVNVGNSLQFLPDANKHTSVIHRNLYNNAPGLTIDHDIRRMALLKQIQGMSIMIQVYGRLDYSVGHVVDFTAFIDDVTDKSMTDEQIIDPVISGKYLITSMSHEITPTKHVCNIELSKDSNNKPTFTVQ